MKKRVLFFSRCDLVYLYGGLHQYLCDEFDIIHVVYSRLERDILFNKFGIKAFVTYKDQFLENYIKDKEVDYHFLDELFIRNSNGRFNLSGAISVDRTFKHIDIKEAYKITTIHYNTWNEVFKQSKPSFFIHEPTSLMINHMASMLCKENDCIYSTHIQYPGENEYDFLMLDSDDGFATELKWHYNQEDINNLFCDSSRIQNYLKSSREKLTVFFQENKKYQIGLSFLIRLFLKSILERYISIRAFKLNKHSDLIDYYISHNLTFTQRLKNIITYRKFDYDEVDEGDLFYYYPLHIEPEAVVLYWADGVYKNQIKLIENIASQLPPQVFLYVKDHPHFHGYREVIDYLRIKEINNVKLISPNIAGKELISKSIGVITLNGTSGFEALILNKHVITFAKPFYSLCPWVKYVQNIKDLKKVLYDLRSDIYEDDVELYLFISAYLRSLKPGFPEMYYGLMKSTKIDKEKNLRDISHGLSYFFKSYSLFK